MFLKFIFFLFSFVIQGIFAVNFDFVSLKDFSSVAPELNVFKARDGENLSFRIYDSSGSENVFIMIHGSAYHGVYLHAMADFLSANNVASVCLPNLRGHFESGSVRGDCLYEGQLEDDLVDLISHLGWGKKNIFLGGHSSGAGLAIRFAGSKYQNMIKGYLLFSPIVPSAGGVKTDWVNVSIAKILGITFLNAIGISRFNHAHVISFNMPEKFMTGTETLSYSYNLNASIHPRFDFKPDIDGLKDNYVVLAGTQDEVFNQDIFDKVFGSSKRSHLRFVHDVKHLDIVQNEKTFELIKYFISGDLIVIEPER